jgi:hypothetical protein
MYEQPAVGVPLAAASGSESLAEGMSAIHEYQQRVQKAIDEGRYEMMH